MTEFFNKPDRLTKLDTILQSWLGTPFREHSVRKGKRGGVDCIMLAVATLVECGHLEDEAIHALPKYAIKHGGMALARFWLEWVREKKCGTEIKPNADLSNFKPGDVILFHGDKFSNHTGIFGLEVPKFWHALIGYDVRLANVQQAPFNKNILKVWRPIEYRKEHYSLGQGGARWAS